MTPPRRGFLAGLGALIVSTPAIVKAESLMPVRGISMMTLDEFADRVMAPRIAEITDTVTEELLHGRNNILTLNMITREAVKMFANSNAFIKNMDRQWEFMHGPQWNEKIGSSLRIRLPNDFQVDPLVTKRYPLDIRPKTTYAEWDKAYG